MDGMNGVKVVDVNISNIRYTDDIILMVDSEVKLQRLVTVVHEVSRERELEINRNKRERV